MRVLENARVEISWDFSIQTETKKNIFFPIIICLQKCKKKTKNTYNKAPTTMFYVVGGKEKVKNII